jgi:hypothetical protein
MSSQQKYTSEDLEFLARLPLSEEQMKELFIWASRYKKDESPPAYDEHQEKEKDKVEAILDAELRSEPIPR